LPGRATIVTVVAMRVIGVGFGRTGTASLKEALVRLGAGPCYHMREVIDEPARARPWLAAAAGHRPDWTDVFAGYQSTVDWPGASYWRELVDAFPAAKIILTTRDPDRWYDSMAGTVLRAWRLRREAPPPADPALRDIADMTTRVIALRVFDGRHEDRSHAIATYERHNADVRAAVPAERLLDFQVAQGWQPLCAFLGTPVPDEPFPRVNDTAEFNRRVQATLSTPPD
jgi:hypothetical protein